MIWNTGSETYGGDLTEQYANGSYAEVWFKEATVGAGTPPSNTAIINKETNKISNEERRG